MRYSGDRRGDDNGRQVAIEGHAEHRHLLAAKVPVMNV